MGKVVKLEKPAERKQAARKPQRRRARRSKTALVLGGGGVTGGVYEIGALRALDLLAVNRTINEFDVYVGTSAGSFVASLAANGVTPEEMMRVVNQQVPTPFRDINMGTVLKLDYPNLAKSLALMPLRSVGVVRTLLANPRNVSMMDLALGLAEGLPPGIYDGSGIETYLDEVLSDPDRVNDFRLLENELYLTATDLDTCERIVFGADGWEDVPISRAAAASTGLPMIYRPAEIKGRHLVDGGIRSTTNVDVAVEAGAKFVIVVNPLVPFVNDFKTKIRTLTGTKTRRVSDMGFPSIGYQVFKMVAYQRLHEMARQWEQRYPGVDIVLIEPEPDDELMFQTPIMSYASRVEIARHGFQSVTTQLAFGYPRFQEICKRHDIEISATRVRKVMKHFEAEEGRTRAWRKILEQTTGALLRQSSASKD